MPITPEQAQALFDQGQISQGTFDRIGNVPLDPIPLEQADAPQQVGGAIDASGIPNPNDPGAQAAIGGVPDLQVDPAITTTPDPMTPLTHSIDVPVVEPVAPPVEAVQPQFAPGTKVTTTTSQKIATDKAEEAMVAQEDAIEAQKDAAEEQAQIGAAQAAQAFGFNQEEQRLVAESSAAEQTLRDKGNAEVSELLEQLDTKVSELSKSKYEGYWANKSIGQKIMGAIALGLGAYSSTVGGGPNHAMNIINASMEDEFKAFQANTKVKLDAIQSSRLSVAAKQRLVKDQILGLQAKKLSDIYIVKSKIGNLSNKFKGAEQKASLAKMNAALDEKLALARLNFEKPLAETVNTHVTREVAGGATEINNELLVPGVGIALTKKSADILKESMDRKSNIKGSLANLNKLVEESGTGTIFDFTDTENELLMQYIDDIAVDMAKLKDPSSVARPSEVELFKEQLFEPGLFQRESGVATKLKQFEGIVDQTFSNKVKSHIKAGTGEAVRPPPVIREINGIRYKFDPVTKQNLGAE